MAKRTQDDSDDDFENSSLSPSKKFRYSNSIDCSQESSQEDIEDEKAVGIIESVQLKNFMCHSKLDFSFSENTNFIIGRNGSGKSAILTALIVGLGGKANAASRGTSVKSMVETGKRTAEVTIKLRNVGRDAFNQEVYGDSIIINRKLSADGASQYKIKSSSGTVVSSKKDELLQILDQFNIQVDNPVMILNQETSRNFLQSKNPKDKYTFFMKATQLEKLKNDYYELEEGRLCMDQEVSIKEKMLPEVEREVKRLEKLWQAFVNMDGQRDKLKRLKCEVAWARVAEKEEEFKQAEAACQKEAKAGAKLREKVADVEGKLQSHADEQRQLQSELQEAMERVQAVQPALVACRKELSTQKERLHEEEQARSRVERKLSDKRSDARALSGRIEELRSVDLNERAREKADREARIERMKEERQEVRSQLRDAEHRYAQLDAAETKASDEVRSLRNEQRELAERKASLAANIQNLQASKKNSLQRFGRHVPQLLREIDSAVARGHFRKRPKGPLGSMIKLKDQRWALATEVCLGRHLYSYLVDNDQDAKTLRQIMTKVMGGERKPAIITSAFNDRVYDYRSNAVQSQYVGLLENLDIEDADVINCLLDQRRVENVALIESNHEARTVLMRESTVPRNCREVITLQGDQVYPAPDFRYYSSSKQRAELLKEGVDDQIREKKAELAETEGRLRDLEAIVRGQQEEAVRARKERSVVGAEVAKLQRSEASLGHKIKELASIEDPPPTNVSMLEAALQEMHDEMSRFEEQLASVKANEARIREELKVHTAKLREIDNSRAELLTASNSCKAKLLEADERTQKLQSQKKSFEEQMRAIDQRQTLSERQLKAFGEVIETLTEEAAKVSPERLHSRKKVKAMESEIQALESQLALEEQRRGSREEICKQYNTAKEKYEKAKAVILELRTFLHKMKAMTVERQNKYVILCQQTVLRLRLMFSSTLIQQNFTGSLDFDHDRETLHIRVEPRKDRAAASGQSTAPQDLKALSGGERSFSTVCFVLALWDTMECPFRIMDEFDIFMDMGKRRVSLEMILEMTKRKSGCQFVFLTPLEMPSIKALQDVNIMIMPEPSRKRKGAALNGTTANNHHHNPGDADENDQ